MFIKYHKRNEGLNYDIALIDDMGETQHYIVYCFDVRPYIMALENVGLKEISDAEFYPNYN